MVLCCLAGVVALFLVIQRKEEKKKRAPKGWVQGEENHQLNKDDYSEDTKGPQRHRQDYAPPSGPPPLYDNAWQPDAQMTAPGDHKMQNRQVEVHGEKGELEKSYREI